MCGLQQVLTEHEGDESFFRVPQSKLMAGLENLGQKLSQWQQKAFSEALFARDVLLLQARACTFHAERKSEYLQNMLDFANRSVDRRAQAKVLCTACNVD